MLPLWVRVPRLPPVTSIVALVKLLDASDKVKVMVSAPVMVPLLARVMATVGGLWSTRP